MKILPGFLMGYGWKCLMLAYFLKLGASYIPERLALGGGLLFAVGAFLAWLGGR